MRGLEKVVNSLRGSYSQSHVPYSSAVIIPSNVDLSAPLTKPTSRAILMGKFYEHLTAALYGGDVCVTEFLAGADEEKEDDCMKITPDVVNNNTRRYFEVKGVCAGQHCMLQDYQLEHYEQLLGARSGYDLSFAFYRHNLHGIKSTWEGNSEELLTALAAKTLYLIVLPYSAITQMHGMINGSHALVSRFQKEGSPFDRCTSVLASTLTRLYTEPEEILQQIAGEDISQYNICRFVSEPISISGYVVPSFPIVFVEDMRVADTRGDLKNVSVDDDVPF